MLRFSFRSSTCWFFRFIHAYKFFIFISPSFIDVTRADIAFDAVASRYRTDGRLDIG